MHPWKYLTVQGFKIPFPRSAAKGGQGFDEGLERRGRIMGGFYKTVGKIGFEGEKSWEKDGQT